MNRDSPDVIGRLLDADADIQARTNTLKTSLDYTLALDKKAAYSLLLRRGGEHHAGAAEESSEDPSSKSNEIVRDSESELISCTTSSRRQPQRVAEI